MSDFFKTGDRMVVYPFRGRKREITVNRTNYKVISSENEDFSKQDLTLVIPTEVGVFGSFELKLFKRTHGEDYYIFKAGESNDFFECNNSFVKEIIVSHGDEIRIGYNRLLFLPKKKDAPSGEDSIFTINPKVIHSNLNIMINGETGTGKTRLAKIIHERSGRRGRFVHLNLSSFSKNLLESEFFGHKKGAFTGAITDHPGAIFEAREGTLFLDEIDSLSLEQQKKLLLFLDSGKYRSVGSNGEKKSNCRFIFSSGQDLCHLVEEGVMRKDFYFRLISEYSVFLPTLRERPGQIENLISSFCQENDLVMAVDLQRFYVNFNWPGNFRQLIGHLKKKKVLAQTRRLIFDEADMELEASGAKSGILLSKINHKTFMNIKKEIFKQRLRYFDGKYCLASESLGVSRATLERSVKS